jgi:hypothetical protein
MSSGTTITRALTHLHPTRRAMLAGGAAVVLAPNIRRAHAETSEVNIAKQFGLLYVQQDIMEREKLIENFSTSSRTSWSARS